MVLDPTTSLTLDMLRYLVHHHIDTIWQQIDTGATGGSKSLLLVEEITVPTGIIFIQHVLCHYFFLVEAKSVP